MSGSSARLSPLATPFYPAATSNGRTKELRWAGSGSSSDEESLPSYLDAARRRPTPADPSTSGARQVSPVPLQIYERPVAARGPAAHDNNQRRHSRSTRPKTELLIGLPHRGREGCRLPRRDSLPRQGAAARGAQGRVPVRQRLGPRVANPPPPLRRRRYSSPDAEGWQERLPRERRASPQGTSHQRGDQQPRRLPVELGGRCLNCLSYGHRRAFCKLPTRCLRCNQFHHVARDCKRPRSPPTGSVATGVVDHPQRFVRARRASHSPGTPCGSDAAGSTDGEGATPCGPAAAGPTPSLPASRTPSPELPRHAAVNNFEALDDNQPAVRRRGEACYVDFSPGMAAEETRLRLALLAQAGNASRDISASELADALLASLGVLAGEVDIKPFHPENFLLVCSSQAVRDRIFAAGRVPVRNTNMVFRTWTRLVHADSPPPMFIRVNIELDGVPPHAWSLDIASKLLAPSCWVEKLDDATANKADLSTFKLTAWTRDIASIPTSRPLEIAEPEPAIVYDDPGMQLIFGRLPPFLRQKKTLTYEVLFHIRGVADFVPHTPSPSPSPPSSDGDSGHDGHPDRGYGESRGQGPRLQGFHVRRGVEDNPLSGFMPRNEGGYYDCILASRRQHPCAAPASSAVALSAIATPATNATPTAADVVVVDAIPAVNTTAAAALPAVSPMCDTTAAVAPVCDMTAAAVDTAPTAAAVDTAPTAAAVDTAPTAAAVDTAPTAAAIPVADEREDPLSGCNSNSVSAAATQLTHEGDATGRRMQPTAVCFPEKEKQEPNRAPQADTSTTTNSTDEQVSPPCLADYATVCCQLRPAPRAAPGLDPMLIEWGASTLPPSPKMIRPLAMAEEYDNNDSAQPPTGAQSPLEDALEDHLVGVGLTGQLEHQQAVSLTQPGRPVLASEDEAAAQRLDMFAAEISHRISTPLAHPKRKAKKLPEIELPKRSSTRLANNKLAKIPAARRGEVLLMRRFDIEPSDNASGALARRNLDTVFHDGVSCGHAGNVKSMFPERKYAARQGGFSPIAA
ncbi:unnamed protein product [Urochloa decumbens]|uniref:CCHC-type domain-containing protein n=1 Tax=Urochloa decumbens TaxID=240449 RepID=A0ABC9GHJ4_9POAL